MPITVTCPGCSTKHTVQDSFAGKPCKCPCGQIVIVPAASGQPQPAKKRPAPSGPAPNQSANVASQPQAPAYGVASAVDNDYYEPAAPQTNAPQPYYPPANYAPAPSYSPPPSYAPTASYGYGSAPSSSYGSSYGSAYDSSYGTARASSRAIVDAVLSLIGSFLALGYGGVFSIVGLLAVTGGSYVTVEVTSATQVALVDKISVILALLSSSLLTMLSVMMFVAGIGMLVGSISEFARKPIGTLWAHRIGGGAGIGFIVLFVVGAVIQITLLAARMGSPSSRQLAGLLVVLLLWLGGALLLSIIPCYFIFLMWRRQRSAAMG